MDTPPPSRDRARRPLRLTGRSVSETTDATPVLLAVFAGFAQCGASDLRAVYRSAPVRSHVRWFRRHRNVFSISTREVVAKPGDDDMLVEEYGERAVEARRPAGYGTRLRGGTVAPYGGPGGGTVTPLEASAL